ncbi:alpha/beta fold hydrolase [Streptomyces sp. NPDC048179]|uniref:alpha/beta fold hydrolase n=1 Tax=Streptomyces sp. NPDC048179 TaxID=3365506 RepID=UPI00371FEA37
MTYSVINDNRLFHTDEGPDDGPGAGSGDGRADGPGAGRSRRTGETLLLVHGATCDSHDWSAQIGAFAARHRVIAPDLRGHGRSSGLSGGQRPREFAADLAELLDGVDAGPVVVVGHSMGAVIASVLAVEYPSLVRAVVAVDPGYGFEAEFVPQLAAAFRVPDPVGTAALVLAGLENPAADGPEADALRVWHRRRILGMDPMTVRDVFHGMFDEAAAPLTARPGVEAYLSRRACPVLTLSAASSLKAKGVDGDWEESLSRHPYSASVVLDGVGHWLFQERPAEFNALVLGWIEGLPPA